MIPLNSPSPTAECARPRAQQRARNEGTPSSDSRRRRAPQSWFSGLSLMPSKNSQVESQRDSGSKPRVARHELPWENAPLTDNPNGVAARQHKRDTTPLGLKTFTHSTQGSSYLATLGFEPESRWDSPMELQPPSSR
jgi:hypothetical protein